MAKRVSLTVLCSRPGLMGMAVFDQSSRCGLDPEGTSRKHRIGRKWFGVYVKPFIGGDL